MNARQSLTRLAHELLAEALRPGDLAIDATAGNGHDTLFLAQQVGNTGEVYAFDVQARALDATALRLEENQCREIGKLCRTGHENMLQRIPDTWLGNVTAITFNLGYLPGSDKQTVTEASSTLKALDQALLLLKPGGILSVLAYRGHAGGMNEAEAVEAWMSGHRQQLDWRIHSSSGPLLFHGIRR